MFTNFNLNVNFSVEEMKLVILLVIVTSIRAYGHNLNSFESYMRVNENGNLKLGTVNRQWKTREVPQLPLQGTSGIKRKLHYTFLSVDSNFENYTLRCPDSLEDFLFH